MELAFIAFVGTVVLMAAELRDFVQRRRTNPATVDSFPAISCASASDSDAVYKAAA